MGHKLSHLSHRRASSRPSSGATTASSAASSSSPTKASGDGHGEEASDTSAVTTGNHGDRWAKELRHDSVHLYASPATLPPHVPHRRPSVTQETDAFGTSILNDLPAPLYCWSSATPSPTRCPSTIALMQLLTTMYTASDMSPSPSSMRHNSMPVSLLAIIVEYTRHIYRIIAVARRREDYDTVDDDDTDTDPITDRSVMVAEWTALTLSPNVAQYASYDMDPRRRNNGTTAASNRNAADRTYPLLEYERHPLFPVVLTNDHAHTLMVMDEYSRGTPMYCYSYYNHGDATSSGKPAAGGDGVTRQWTQTLIHEKLMRRWNMSVLNGRLVGMNRYGLTMTCPIPSPSPPASTGGNASDGTPSTAILLPSPKMADDSYIFGDDVCQVVSGGLWYVYAPETETSPTRGEVYNSALGQWQLVASPPNMTFGKKVILAAVPSVGGILEFPGGLLPNHDGDDEAFDYGAAHVTPITKPPPPVIHYYDRVTDAWTKVAWTLDGIHFMTRIKHAWIIEDNDGYAACTTSLTLSARVTVILIGHHSLRGDTQWIRHFDSIGDLLAPLSSSPSAAPASPSGLSVAATPRSADGMVVSPKIHRDGDDGWHLVRSFSLRGLDFTIKDFTLA